MAIDILIVDDSPVMRGMVKRVLLMLETDFGTIHEAENGAEGIDVLGREDIDLAIIDINMPVMGGEEMIERMRAEPRWVQLPVIVISTESSQTRIARLAAQGVRFLHKPFAPEQIRDIMSELLECKDDA